MKFIRFLLTTLATVAVLALLLAGALLAPPVQTWFARMELLDLPGVQGSLGSLSASFGTLEVEDADLQYNGVVLRLPSLRARLPILEALWHRRVLVGSVVAKGWSLDLSPLGDGELDGPVPDAGAAATAPAAPARRAALAFGAVLAGRHLPFDGSLDGVDLEGEVRLAVIAGRPPVRVHVTATGGGMADGHEGSLVIDASRVPEDTDSPGDAASAHCRLTVSMDSPRTAARVEARADLSGATGSRRVDLTVAAVAARARDAGGETYSIDASRGDRHLLTLLAGFPDSSGRLSGAWTVDLRDADLAPFLPGRPLPSLAAAGKGAFDADGGLERVHAVGRLVVNGDRLGVCAPPLARLGALAVDSKFDVTRSAGSLHVESLNAAIAGDRPMAEVAALQPFALNAGTGGVSVANPRLAWLQVAVRAFPMDRMPVLPGGLTCDGGDAHGAFTVTAADGGFAVRPEGPLAASGVSIGRSGRTVARDLNLSVSMLADFDAKQWQFQWSPLAISGAGRRLATLEVRGSQPAGAGQALAFSGEWKADLDALAAMPGLGWITGRTASGTVTGSLGATRELECKAVVAGHDPTHTLSTTVNADQEPSGAGEVLAPLKVQFGASVSDIAVEASWAPDKAEPRAVIKLSGDSVALEHLRLVAAPLAAAGGVALPDGASRGGAGWSMPGARDRHPFWGDWVGRVSLAFEKLRTGDQDFADVGGSVEVDHASLQLEGGHAELPSKTIASLEGSIRFDAGRDPPYVLSGSASGLSKIDSALLLPAHPGEDPVLEGHFTVAGTLSGSGINLDDLIAGTQEEFRIDGVNGIIRLLRTDIADAIPEAKEPVSDTLGDVGNLVGSVLLGIKGHSIEPAKNKVGKVPEAVINFTNQVAEIGYDRIAVTAVRGPDRTIRLTHLEMTAPDTHLTGTGMIRYARGLPLSQEPASFELRLGVRDVLANLLATAGLLAPSKDSLGYALLREPIRFGGTLDHIDETPWHDLLARAATQKAPAGSQGAAARSR